MAFAGTAMASPVYLTLQGTVSSVWDRAGLASDQDIKIGDNLSYVVKVDKDQTGSMTFHNGRTRVLYGTSFTSLESGNLLGQNSNRHSVQLNWGNIGYGASEFQSGNGLSNIFLTEFDNFDNWQVGQKVDSFYEIGHGNGRHFSRLDFNDMTITRIADSAPTPVPAGILLMGAGLGAVGFVRRKIRR